MSATSGRGGFAGRAAMRAGTRTQVPGETARSGR